MSAHIKAGTQAKQEDLINIPRLVAQYFQRRPDPQQHAQSVQFGTSGHRGSAQDATFNCLHIQAITQAIAELRNQYGATGPVYVGKDTHALSEPAFMTVIEVLIAHQIEVRIQSLTAYTPTPAISHAILQYNSGETCQLADGIVITPSHNPPQDGGIKYNPTHGGPAQSEITQAIENRANQLIQLGEAEIKQITFEQAATSPLLVIEDIQSQYITDLDQVIDIASIQKANLHLAVDALGGAGSAYWHQIAAQYQLDLTIINDHADASFQFMTLDKDGIIRMDCSSPYAMAGLLALKDDYDLAFANDPDFDRHGIVTPAGLMNPNHFLAVCIDYLYRHRCDWPTNLQVGKTLVTSGLIDQVADGLERTVCELPVGFKWFVDGLYNGWLGFGGEESAGAAFLRKNGKVWTTDKDGIILCLLAAEIMAVTGISPQAYYEKLVEKYGQCYYQRVQAPATEVQKSLLKSLTPQHIAATELANDLIINRLTHAPGNQESIGGLKITTDNGWFAARPSGTESMYKIYCESYKDEGHLQQIEREAQDIIQKLFEHAGV